MRTIVSPKLLSILVLSLSCLVPGGIAQAPAGACGSQPYCVETNDFVATITSFRTSATTSNVKIIDTTIRFQNKTNQQLILGYAINSGMATDDQGNRLAVAGPNGFRGIGLVVAGTNFDPKFVIHPGGYGDAQFELIAQGWPKIVGFTHQFDLTVNEINSYEGNQHTIGGEFPLHFQGLKNGSSGSAPALGALANAAVGSGPCGLAGAQGAAGQASATVSGAASALSSFGSLFGKKKAAQKADKVSSAAAGCDPHVNNVASVAGGLAGAAAAGNAQQAPNAAPAQQMTANGAQVQQMMAAAGSNPTAQQIAANANIQAAVQASAAQPQANAQAVAATAANPGNLAASAFSKFKLSQLKKQQKAQQQAQQQTPQQVSPQQVASVEAPTGTASPDPQRASSAAQQNMTGANMQGAQLEEQANPDQMQNAATKAATAGKYDILGIHLGMSAKEAAAILHARGMQLAPETIKYDFLPGPLTYGVTALNSVMLKTSGSQPGGEKVYLMLAMPPNQQVVSKVSRFLMFTKENAPTSDGLVADLIKKYGTPSYDSHPPNLYAHGYRELYWVDDAQGHRMNVTDPSGSYNTQVNNCRSIPTFAPTAGISASYNNDPAIEVDSIREKIRLEKGYNEESRVQAQCANLTIVYAKLVYGYPIGISAPDVAGGLVVVIGSAPLDRTTTEATHNFLMQSATQRDAKQKQAAQKNKPAL
ncbi:MAG TPA: hypothetical protein VFU86_13625 [Terriglobales bacterium]|nr:hypothetical protein [Terriglobales bacterium]